MWKKILVVCLGLVGTFSIAYTYDYVIFASSSTYQSGGDLTGRVNIALSHDSGSTLMPSSIGLQKGDKVLMGTKNPSDPSISLEWQLLNKETYTDYGCITSSVTHPVEEVCSNSSITNWLTISTKDIGKTAPNIAEASYQIGRNTDAAPVAWKHVKLASYTDSPTITALLTNTQTEINKTDDGKLLTYRNLQFSRYKYNNPQAGSVEEMLYYKDIIDKGTFPNTINYDSLNKSLFLMPIDFAMLSGDGTMKAIDSCDKIFHEPYWSSIFYSDGGDNSYIGFPILTSGASGHSPKNSGISNTYKLSVRPLAYLDLQSVVFAISNGTSNAIGKVKQLELPNSYASIVDETASYQGMKLRIEDTNLTDTTFFNQIENSKGSKIQVVAKNESIYLNADAKSGGNATTGFNTISALVFDTSGNFKYYQPLGTAKDSGVYEFDTTGIGTGKYSIGIVNEVYKEKDNTPTKSSKITKLMDLEVVESLSLGITVGSGLEYKKNVNQNDQIASISTTGGAGTISYKIVSDTSVSGHSSDYTKFDIGTDASGNPTVIVKETSGLAAGDYYFKVNAVDANGDPTGGVDSSTVHVNVAKAEPNLAFTDTTSPINVAVNGTAFTEAFTHDNTDTSDADFALSYSSSITGVATVDSPSANTDLDVEVTPGATAGNTTLTVALASTKNYKAASITKTIHTYPNISLIFNPKSASFSIEAVATIGSEVGTITLTGDSADYTYSMATATEAGLPVGSDTGNGYFEVDNKTATSSKTMKIVTQLANVPQGTHNIVMKAVDQYNQIAYVRGTITVSGKAQTGFEFYDYKDTSINLTNKKLTIYYGETNAKLVAMGGESTGSIKYDFETGEPKNIIDIDSLGKITVKDIGTVKVKAIHEKDSTYSEAVINMDVEVKPCKQTISFNDTTDPKDVTFDSTNPTILQDAIGKIKTGMPNAGNAGVGSISYHTSDKSIATVDSSGNVTLLDPGSTMKSFTLTATINHSSDATHDPHFTTETITKTIKVYPKGSATWNQSDQPQADNNMVSDPVGKVTVSGGAGTPTFNIPKTTTADNIDYSFFAIDSAGKVTINNTITHDDLVGKTINTSQNAYEMKIVVEVTNAGSTTTLPIIIYVKGATRTGLEFDDKDPLTMEITKIYKEAPNNTFALDLNQVITGTTISYSLSSDAGNPTDVISVLADGTATIINANEGGSYQAAKVEALIPMCDGYEETVVKGNVRIKKADQILVFSQNPINTDISVSSLNIAITGHKDGNALAYSSSDSDIDVDPDPSDPDQMIIKPNGKAVNGVTITALASGDRNYNSTSKPVTLNISATVTQPFVANFPKMTYGDTDSKVVTITPKEPSSTYTYTVTDTSILEIDSSGNITIHHAGDTTVQVSKTDASGTLGPYSFNVSVKPRAITVTIDDQAKYVGMENPAFTSQITSGSLVGSDSLGAFTYKCLTKENIPVNKDSEAGKYPITGAYGTPNTDYKVTIVNGELEVKQDAGENTWYHLEDVAGNPTTSSKWHKDSVDVVLNPSSTSSAGVYDQIGNSPAFTNAGTTPDRFTVTEEGETIQDIYFRIDPAGSSPNKGATTSPIQETILIDKTAPTIKSITASDTNNKLQDIINKLSGGIFFKPGTQFEITTSDEKDELETSGTASIDYKIYKQNEDKTYGSPMKQDTLTVSNEKAKITIGDTTGTYKICVLPKDNAGNVPEKETCKELTLKKINVDIDGDGEDDFNDINGNGCADFNIIYTDKEDGKEKILNVDASRDGIPEMNIDSDGDGKPDINVDTDNDGKPDLNLLIMTKELWKPTTCVTQHGEQYASGVDLTPVINVDLTNDNIPDINIDNNGDFKPDLNISIDGKTPYTNIYTFHEWKPKHDYTSGAFAYDSIGTDPDEPKRELNIDTDGDGFPDVNIDLNNDGKADINIDLNGDEIPDIDVDTTGDGKADTNIDTNGDGKPDENIVEIKEWEPEHDCESNGMKYDTMRDLGKKDQLEDQGIVVVKPDGDVFDPSYALEVENITDTIGNVTINDIKKYAGGQEIKQIYEVSLLKNSIRVQPNGSLKIKIPYDATIKSPKLIVEQSDGTYKLIEPDIEEGYLVYESNYLGKVAVIGDGETSITPKDPTTDIGGGDDDQGTSVKGSYTSVGNSVGGASTSDTSSFILFMVLGILSMMVLIFMIRKQDKAVKKQ